MRCSIVRTRVPGGGWTDLHTFRSPDAPAFPGPLWKIAMAPNGRDGWVWGQHVYSTHDGGSTWSQVSGFPASDGAAYNDEIIVGGDEAWAQVDLTGGPRMLLRTPVGSDSWTRSSTPTTSFYAINALPDGRVVLELDNDRWSIKDQHLLVGDGTTWQHEKLRFYRVPSLFHGALFTQSYPFLAANSGSLGASGYDRRGNYSSIPVGTTGTTASRPVGFVEQLFVRGDQAAVVNPDGVTPVHLRLGEDDRIADSALLGNRVVLVTYGGRFFSSTDNGRHWREIT